MQQLMEPTAMLIKRVVKIIDGHTLAFQKAKTIIAPDIISWVDTIDGDRIAVLFHFPHNGCNVVDVVKVSNKKQVHIFYPLAQALGRCNSTGCLSDKDAVNEMRRLNQKPAGPEVITKRF
jgi:hypothetical protein